MLVRFKSDVGGFTSFGDVAVKLLRMTGHSGTVPGAIPAEDIPRALSKLEEALAAEAQNQAPDQEQASSEAAHGGARDGDADREPPVSLNQRAFPLLELLRDAVREECGIMWDRA